MDKKQSEKNAGILWRVLSDGSKWNYESLKETLGMSDRELCAAIGWLSREDKIQVENCHDGKELFFLNMQIYY